MKEYHGIVIDLSQKDKSIFNRLEILSKNKSEDWMLYKVEIKSEKLKETLEELQQNMEEGTWYIHFYRGNELIVVYKDRIFRMSVDKSTWNEAVEYGKSLGIPAEQLNFFPIRIEDETF